MRRLVVLLVLLGSWRTPAHAQRAQVDNQPQHIVCDSGCGGPASFLDNASFTFGTTSIGIGGFVLDDVATNAATENRAAAARISANRMQLFQIGDGAGNERRALVSAGNSLQVTCDNCGGSTFLDNAAFTFGTSTVLNIGFVVDDVAPNAATENSAAAPRMSTNRVAYSQLRDAAGNERGANVTAANALKVDGSAVTQPVSGTFWQATQPVSGTFWQATQPVSGTFWQATQPVSGTVTTTPPANASTNVAQIAGTATDVNSGTKSAGTIRVVIATDQPALTNKLLVTPDSVALPANQSVNVSQINGVTVLMGAGNTGTGSQRVTLASDQVITPSSLGATATTTDSLSECVIVSAASTNSNSCKGSAGNVYGYELFNTTTTVYYLRLYNSSSAPTCSSATGFIRSIPIPPAAAAGQVGGAVAMLAIGVGYGTGVGYCLTGGSSSTDNTNAAVGIFGAIKYK